MNKDEIDINNIVVSPYCSQCGEIMKDWVSNQKDYKMWKCPKCGHNLYKRVSFVPVIYKKI